MTMNITFSIKMFNTCCDLEYNQGHCRGVDYHKPTCQWCWNDIGCIWLTCSLTQLVHSYFAKTQPCGLDFTRRNWTKVNTYHLLLSSSSDFWGFFFASMSLHVKVNSLAFVIRNCRPYTSKFVSHVATAVWLKQQSASSKKKAMRINMESKSGTWKREKKQKMARLRVKSICGSLTMRQRAALAIICHWMHNLQAGQN